MSSTSTTTANIWEQTLASLEVELDSAAISTWFRNTQLYETTENKIIVACTDAYSKRIIEQRFSEKINQIIASLKEKPTMIEFIVKPNRLNTPVSGPLFDKAPTDQESKPQSKTQTAFHKKQTHSSSNLNTQYTLENFVVGMSNRVVYAAATSVVEEPGKIYNPLFVFGITGVGKTHLLHAIGNQLREKYPDKKIIYTPAESFVNDLIEHIRRKREMQNFRSKYRDNDILLVDDIQFLAGKDASQEEFYHTFNELYQKGSQIVLASDREPDVIDGIADRLVSRFKGGLMVKAELPDYETRLAIVQTKAEELNLDLPNPACEYIADISQQNVREIQGILLQVKSFAYSSNQSLNLATVRSLIDPQEKTPSKPKKITPEMVMDLVTKEFDTSIKDLCGRRRKQEIVRPRQAAMFLLRNELGMKFEEIGEILGGRDHTTVIHGCEKIKKQLEENLDPHLKANISSIREYLYS